MGHEELTRRAQLLELVRRGLEEHSKTWTVDESTPGRIVIDFTPADGAKRETDEASGDA